MKKWMLIPALAGVVAIGGVALANDSVSSTEASKNQFITLQKAKELALQKVDGVVTDIELEKDDNRYYYDIELQDDKFEYDVEVDAVTGKIIKFEKDYDDDKNHIQTGKVMSTDEAIAIAKTKAAGVVKEIELGEDDGRKVYEIEMKDDEFEYDIELDAVTGEVLEFEKDRHRRVNQNVKTKTDHSLTVVQPASEKQVVASTGKQQKQKGRLSKEQVLAIANKHASGVVTDFELDDYKYEIEMRDGNIEYELEIHAYSGVVLSFERDDD